MYRRVASRYLLESLMNALTRRALRLLLALRAKWTTQHIALAVGAGIVALLIGVLVGRAIEQRMLGDRVMPRVVVWGIDYGGWTKERVRASLERRKLELQVRPCSMVVQGHAFDATPAQAGFDFDVEQRLNEITLQGRTGPWWRRWGWRIARLWTAAQVPLSPTFDIQKLDSQVSDWQRQGIADPPVQGQVTVQGTVAKGIAPRPGMRIAASSVPSTWSDALSHDAGDAKLRVVLPVEREEPRLDPAALEQAVKRAQQLVAAPLTLTHEWGELSFSPDVLGAALQSKVVDASHMELELDDAAIDGVLSPLRVALERPSANARFIVEKDEKLRLEPSLTARRVLTQEVAKALWKAAELPERRGVLPISEVDEATLTTEQAAALGITAKVSTFVTYFPCCQPRVKNIQRMAELLDGTVLRPGEVLSVNERVGERTKARGFVAGPTIVEGEMEDTFGGGVSQFATTLFNAVFHGGYQIIERQAHSYYFPRYPLGHEATLSFPKPDLIFKNDTAFGLLIQARCSKTSIRITLFGDNEGRRVQRKVSPAFDLTDPPVDYVPDDKLKPDEHKELERGSRGFSVLVTRILTTKDGQHSEEARKVVYKPREAVVAVHPCNIPKPDEDHTGEECPKLEPEDTPEPDTTTPVPSLTPQGD